MVRIRVLAAVLGCATAACSEPWANEDLGALAPAIHFTALTTQLERSCGLDTRGLAWCWGSDASSTALRELCYIPASFPFDEQWMPCWKRPAPVEGGHVFTQFKSAAVGTWGLDTEGRLWGWGINWYLTIAPGTHNDAYTRLRPVATVEQLRFKAFDGGSATMCGITTGGQIWCWGEPNMITTNTPLANTICPVGTDSHCGVAPHQIGTATDWVDIGVGNEHACALNAAGRIYCWGLGDYGELGVTSTPTCTITGISVRCSSTPLLVSASLTFESLSAKGDQTCAITTADVLYCWGMLTPNSFPGTTVPVSLGTGFTQVHVSGRPGICAIKTNGSAWCTGVIGIATNLAQVAVGPFVGSSAAMDHACLWNAAGQAWCFGDKTMGQLGDGISAAVFGPTLYEVAAPFKY